MGLWAAPVYFCRLANPHPPHGNWCVRVRVHVCMHVCICVCMSVTHVRVCTVPR